MKHALRLRPVLFLAASLWISAAGAQTTYNYTGATNGNWSASGNWTPGGVPGAADSVVQTTAGLNFRVDANEQVSALTLNAGTLNVVGAGSAGATTLTVGGALTAQTGVLIFRNSTGTLSVSAGSVVVQDGAQLWFGNGSSALASVAAGAVTLNGGAELAFNAASAALGDVAFSGAGSLVVDGLATASSTSVSASSLSSSGATAHVYGATTSSSAAITALLTLDGASGTATYAGKIQNNGSTGANASLSLAKTGGSTQILSGAQNTYTGGTTVSGGALLVANASGSGIGTGAAQVNAGGTLGGTGIIALGAGNALTVASGGFLLAGDGAATGVALTVNNDVALGSGSVLRFVLGSGGAHSTLARTGGVWSFASGQLFDFVDLQAGTYDGIITGLGSDPTGEAGWALYDGAGYSAVFAYDAAGGGSIDVTVTQVPEPAAAFLLLAASGAAAFLFRRPAPGGIPLAGPFPG